MMNFLQKISKTAVFNWFTSRIKINGYTSACILVLLTWLVVVYVKINSNEYVSSIETQKLSSHTPEMTMKSSLDTTDEEKTHPVMVLLVTLWRSGSSWLGELISKSPNTFYLYEPLHMLIKNIEKDLGLNISEAEKLFTLKELFHCGITTRFLEHYEQWSEIYPKKYCKKGECTSLNASDVVEECLFSDYRAIKTVRLRLESVEDLFLLPSLAPLKVVFLVRDPRGTMTSMYNIGKTKKLWNVSPLQICTRLRSNMWAFNALQETFHDRLFLVRYEDIAIEPFERASELWDFIQGSRRSSIPMPLDWQTFLSYSQSKKKDQNPKNNPFAIHKRSTQDWQSWRYDITDKVLEEVQADCKDVIENLGYRYFSNIEETRNFSIESITKQNCKTLPCL